jgi:uncharacterized protein YbaR (Trm112 family)
LVDQSLLDILVCPETKQPLHAADAALLARVNSSIASGSLKTRSGQVVSAALDAALVRQDDTVLYPVRDDIPIMLIDESIPLSDQR